MSSSTSKKSLNPGLRRSCSSSGIPLPSRLSTTGGRTSNQYSRSKSSVRPAKEKLSLDKAGKRSGSYLNDMPGLTRQRSGSLVRQTLNTPLSQPMKKSPMMSSIRKDNRPLSDKRWQYEQIVKVRYFAAEYFPYLDNNNIKSGIPLELFIGLVDGYFKLIDKRISVTRENYTEEVPANLKRYHYPSSVKPSLMKTVNTPHSWPHVLAILAWLTDVIYEINHPVETETGLVKIIRDCMFEMNNLYFNQLDDDANVEKVLQKLQLQIGEFLQIDYDKVNQVEVELAAVEAKKASYMKRRAELMKTQESLSDHIRATKEKCESYILEVQQLDKVVGEQQLKYEAKMKDIDQEVSKLEQVKEELTNTVAGQPQTKAEEQKLTQEIKELQNTTKLKEKRVEQQREVITAYDFKLSDAKQKVEAAAYDYNNVISNLELRNPALRKLQIRESGFARMDTADEIKEVDQMLKDTVVKTKQDCDESRRKLEELQQLKLHISQEVASAKKEVENLMKFEAELSITLNQKVKKDELERQKAAAELEKLQQKLMAMKESQENLTPYKEKVNHLEEKSAYLQRFKESMQLTATGFFITLNEKMQANLEKHMAIIDEVHEAVSQAQDKVIQDSQARVKELKKVLEE